MGNQIYFNYGIFADSLETQANAQGYTLGNNSAKYEKVREAINTCGFHVATESQVDAMFKKLQKNVVANLKEIIV